MGRELTVKQRLFVNFLVGAAHGNGTAAARMAGYRGDARQLAVQANSNMKNRRVHELINQKLEMLVEPSLSALEDGLKATKQRAGFTKDGYIVYGDPEPDYRTRTATATRILDRYDRSSSVETRAADERVGGGNDTKVLEFPVSPAGENDAVNDVDQLAPDDRVLLQQVEEIDAKLAALDHEPDGADGEH